MAKPNYRDLPNPIGYQSFVKDIGPLMCDRYTLTMTYAAWALGFVDKKKTTANIFCRSLLDNGEVIKDPETDEKKNVQIPYLVNAGLGLVAEWYDGWKWNDNDLHYLAKQDIDDGKGNMIQLFPQPFLEWLSDQRLTQTIHAIPEGQLIFPHEPSMRLTGPWWQQMMVEAGSLNLISSSTNLATVATQVRMAAQREARNAGAQLIEVSTIESAPLAEMALRRGVSIGALQSARGAAIGGWDSTSNDYAAKCYGIKAMGTFAHAWIMLHDTEEEAFENWAKVFPGATIFLADTYDTIEGAKTAIRICKKYGLNLKGIRLDSGDTAYLSCRVQELLNEAGYTDTKILATDNVSVKKVASLFRNVATNVVDRDSFVGSFGSGSEIAVNRNNPLHDFVMKLAARHDPNGAGDGELIRNLIKLSETTAKTTLPGMIDAIRYIDNKGMWAGDTIIPADLAIGEDRLVRAVYSEHIRTGKVLAFPAGAPFIRLLQPWMVNGNMVQANYKNCDAAAILAESRKTCQDAIKRLDPSHLRITPHTPLTYGVGLAAELVEKRHNTITKIKARRNNDAQLQRFAI